MGGRLTHGQTRQRGCSVSQNSFFGRCGVCLGLLLALGLSGCNGASNAAVDRLGRDGNKGFMVKTLKRGWWTRKYGLFVPMSYYAGTKQKYPVLIFLHGIGEGDGLGEGNLKNMTVGLGPAIARKADKFDFIAIFPQSGGTWGPDSDYAHDVFTALDEVSREYPVDPDRVALTGLSTGGAGTWAIGARYSDRFSALVPMASNGSHPDDAEKLTHMPVRAYCSVFGDLFAGWNDMGMVNKIKQLNPSADAHFYATPTVGHDCWEKVYAGDELYEWLLKQRRSSAVAAQPSLPSQTASKPVIEAAAVAPPAAHVPPRILAPAPVHSDPVILPPSRIAAEPAPAVQAPPRVPAYVPKGYSEAPAPRPVVPAQPSKAGSPPAINTPW